MVRVEAARRFDVPVERGFALITDTSNWSVQYEPRKGFASVLDRFLLMRAVRQAFQRTFAALEPELTSLART